MNKTKLKVGFDLDGVLLYNPLMIVRPFLKFIRKYILKKASTGSFTAKTKAETYINWVYIKLSLLNLYGYSKIIELIESGLIEAYIVTSRHSAYEKEFSKSVVRLNKGGHFKKALYNKDDLEPFEFKRNAIKNLKLDYFVEDNLDVVLKLNAEFPDKIFWITNLVDKRHAFKKKFNNLFDVAIELRKHLA